MFRHTILALIALLTAESGAAAREWSDTTGKFKLDAEFFAASEDTVVLKKRNGSLVGVIISQLSPADQQFLADKRRSLEADAQKAPQTVDQLHTWTSKEGFEFRGRVIAFGRRDVKIERVAGIVNVNGTAFSRLNTFYQHIVPKIVARYGDSAVQTERDVERWLREKAGNPPTFTVEGVLMKLEDGSELAVPFFLFSDEDLAVLQPGWEQWKSEQSSEADRKREDFLLSVQADSYQSQPDAAAVNQQIQMMQLEMLAVNAGLVSVWEVMLSPSQYAYARPMSVMVTAQNSLQAQDMVLQRYPGYTVVGVRRASY